MSGPAFKPAHWVLLTERLALTEPICAASHLEELQHLRVFDGVCLAVCAPLAVGVGLTRRRADDILLDELFTAAERQYAFEAEFERIMRRWHDRRLHLEALADSDVCVITNGPALLQEMEADHISLTAMSASAYTSTFRVVRGGGWPLATVCCLTPNQALRDKQQQLVAMAALLPLWLDAQRAWQEVAPLFRGSDVARVHPGETRSFVALDKEWAGMRLSVRA
jgi:hypothetical protein